MLNPFVSWIKYQFDKSINLFVRRKDFLSEFPEPEFESVPRKISCHAAIVDDRQLERVTKCGFNRTLAEEVATLKEKYYLESPLQIYRMGPASVVGGKIITPQGYYFLNTHTPALLDILKGEKIEGPCVLPNSMQGLHYFGHWLGDDCTAFEAFREHKGLVSMVRPSWGDAPVYQRLFNQNWKEYPAFCCDDLTVVRDIGFSQKKASRYHDLRTSMRRNIKMEQPQGRVVFIRRGADSTPRDITNWPELEERLQSVGVLIVTPEKDTIQFIRQILDAPLIISVEGSQACHAIYGLKEGGALLVLQPPDRFYAAPQEWMRCLGMRCGIIVGSKTSGGFRIDPDEVLQMIDKLLNLVEANN